MTSEFLTQGEAGNDASEVRIKDLEEENELLLSQLHQIQEDLEWNFWQGKTRDSTYSAAPQRIAWVADELPEVVAENLRLRTILEVQKRTHDVVARNALNVKVGDVLIQGVESPAGLLRIPGKLGRLWRESNRQKPPDVLGGQSYGKLIETYRAGGVAAVDALLTSASVSPGLQANALTALARSLVHVEADQAAEFARKAYSIDPRAFRLKWLAFRLHEAGEVIEAEAVLETLPPHVKFSDSEARQASRLRYEAKQARLHAAKQETEYTERRAQLAQQWSNLAQERDEQTQLAAERSRKIDALQTAQTQLEQENRRSPGGWTNRRSSLRYAVVRFTRCRRHGPNWNRKRPRSPGGSTKRRNSRRRAVASSMRCRRHRPDWNRTRRRSPGGWTNRRSSRRHAVASSTRCRRHRPNWSRTGRRFLGVSANRRNSLWRAVAKSKRCRWHRPDWNRTRPRSPGG
jgi:hypothetical protein